VANLKVITKTEFTKKSWKRNPDYFFSAKDTICPLGAAELPLAAMCMPLAFSTIDGEYSVVAVQGLQQGVNFFVDAEGKWIGRYIPVAYRGHPFALANNPAKKGELVLCIDSDNGLLIDDDTGEPFFDEDSEPTHSMRETFKFLSYSAAALKAATLICNSLSEHGLLKPWEVKCGSKKIAGLYCIDEDALDELPSDAYAELRVAGAIPVIYCQLLSMQQISSLTLFSQQKEEADSLRQDNELNFDGTSTDGNISFDNL
jgi:hypothetical protein